MSTASTTAGPELQPASRSRKNVASSPTARQGVAGDGTFLSIDIGSLIRWLRAGLWTIVTATVLGAIIAAAYASLVKPRYTATTEMIVHPANLEVVPNDLHTSQRREVPLFYVDSKRRVLTSGNVLSRVVERLDLEHDPEFNQAPPAMNLRALLLGPAGEVRSPAAEARQALAERVSADRDERSFVVTLSVWSHDPEKAVLLSDAIVDAFQQELARGDSAGAERAANSLLERLDELKNAVTLAEERVEAFRNQHDLHATGEELMSTRSMAELTALTVAAQARLSEAQSRYDALLEAGNDPQANGAILNSATISDLKQQYAAISRLNASRLHVLGPHHPEQIALQQQLQSMQQEIDKEVARIIEAARDDVEQAKANLGALQGGAQDARSIVETKNAAQVRLRELQRDAASKAAVYESFLARARQVSEHEGLDTTDIRVISPAVVPSARSWPPRTSLLGLLGAIAGFSIAVMVAIGRGILAEQWQFTAARPRGPVGIRNAGEFVEQPSS